MYHLINNFGEDYDEWVAPSETRNYLLNDTILDWFKYHGETNGYIKDDNFSGEYDYFKFLMERGNEYELHVINDLIQKYPEDIKIVSKPGTYFSFDNVKKTIELMNSQVPIIYQANLINYKKKIYGIADIIIRSDLINKYFELPSEFVLNNPRSDKYLVIDIKFSTIHEDQHGLIKNKGSMKSYKGQIYLYNKIINEMQNFEYDCGFILGRRYIEKDSTIRDGKLKLGVINYSLKDSEIIGKSNAAIEWIRWVRNEGINYNPKDNTIKPLMPNMNNRLDYPWHNMKKQIAISRKDLTLLWCCGTKNRDICFDNNIYSFDQNNFDIKKVGLSDKRSKVIKKIINVNKNRKIIDTGDIKKSDISYLEDKLRFFVDFEFVNTNDLSFDVNTRVHLYMIGIGHINPNNNKWEFENYVSDKVDLVSEENILKKFIQYINDKVKLYNNNDYTLIHWSKAEPSLFTKLQSRYNIDIDLNWYDLLNTFRQCPITQKGVYDFGLKNVAKNLKKNNLIKTEWNSTVMDGLGASMAIINGLKHYDLLKDIPEIPEIQYYNEVDCKVLSEIYNLIK